VVLLIVWIAVAVVAVVVLGSIAYGLVGAMRRLGREIAALDRDLRPVLAQVQASAGLVAATRGAGRSAGNGDPAA
jgi:hypothetical protein